ncbi:MAG: DUF429 domain-containing protein [Candidatus Anstonellales archaeon]
MKILGLDLAGSEKRATGYCIIEKGKAKHGTVYMNQEILNLIKNEKPNIVAIDAPLSLPAGRKKIEERNNKHFRECDLMLRKKGIKFFPITLGPMRMLTKRGMELKKSIEKIGKKIKVMEVFPGATYDVYGIRRKNKKEILEWAKKFGVDGRKAKTQDELDAIACAITGKLYAEGKATLLKGKDGAIVIPKV